MNKLFRLHLTYLVVLLSFIPLGVDAQTTHTVTVGDNSFSPSQLTIQQGDIVRWVNAAGGNIHDVTSDTGAWTASPTASSFTFEVTFNQVGVFPYFCTVHPSSMTGTITVQAAASAAEVELVDVTVQNEGSALLNNLQAVGEAGKPAPNAFAQGDQFDIEAVIRNNGTGNSGVFNITYYASTDNVVNASDTELGTFPVADLTAGQTRSQQNLVDVPDSLPAGQYFIGGILSLSDSNAANNTAVDNVSVTITGPFFINSGLNDVWATPGKNSQGILFAVFPDVNVMFSAWFTYDSERPPQNATAVLGAPDQRWLTMQGEFDGDTADLQIFVSTGGVFDSASPPPEDAVSVGTMTIIFHDCANATATYSIPSLGLMNTIPLVRVVPDNIALCQEINIAMQP